jgi:hypothetical protein
MVGSKRGDENKKIMTIPKDIFFFNILTTIGIVEQEQKGVIKAKAIAAIAASSLFVPANYFSIFS